MIRIEGLGVIFGKGARAVHAVRDVSFSVDAGESFGLVGESGSGKSTVLRAIAGLTPGWTGGMQVDGIALGPKRETAFHKHLQMVFQDPYGSLHPRHTVNDILSEPLIIHKMDQHETRILAALDEVGLGASFRFRYPHQLSGGQRQRIAIARALILEPRVVLLDEPTSALDVSVQAEILNLLVRLREDRGLTYVMVSHNLAVVAHLCERIAVMNRGQFVEEMTAGQLRAGKPAHGYTSQLLTASKGYDREAIAAFVEFE
ncbi:MAG: ABC transporter ATP-binding protein [Rhodospirillaceae bacterium]|jgi:peptide/nickel transport system ATP-binding protein|nr:ABC transporter ATP-binding protein [Rhodospirillaceae bacterium]MBT6138456.1 ABC transporter ATP-binding protein [Rhodospirillaceae bacterium]